MYNEKMIRLVNGVLVVTYVDSGERDLDLLYDYGNPMLHYGYVTECNFLKTIEHAYEKHEQDMHIYEEDLVELLGGFKLTWEEEYEMYLEKLTEEEPLEDTFSITDQLLNKHKVWERRRKRSSDNRSTLWFHKGWIYGLDKTYKDAKSTKVYTEEEYVVPCSEECEGDL